MFDIEACDFFTFILMGKKMYFCLKVCADFTFSMKLTGCVFLFLLGVYVFNYIVNAIEINRH